MKEKERDKRQEDGREKEREEEREEGTRGKKREERTKARREESTDAYTTKGNKNYRRHSTNAWSRD